jgi:hypothetical protein
MAGAGVAAVLRDLGRLAGSPDSAPAVEQLAAVLAHTREAVAREQVRGAPQRSSTKNATNVCDSRRSCVAIDNRVIWCGVRFLYGLEELVSIISRVCILAGSERLQRTTRLAVQF